MAPHGNLLGIMKPLGGGDPVPLRKAEMIVGRRPSCDICLDFYNVSGKHCQLRYSNQVWHVRDLGSTNGTTINGNPISSDHSVMPDDELGIAGHIYSIDYEPGAPASILNKESLLEETEIEDTRRRHSLMELAGLNTDDDRPGKRTKRPTKAPETIERVSADEAEFDDALPDDLGDVATPEPIVNDDDFLKMIQEDVFDPKKK